MSCSCLYKYVGNVVLQEIALVILFHFLQSYLKYFFSETKPQDIFTQKHILHGSNKGAYVLR